MLASSSESVRRPRNVDIDPEQKRVALRTAFIARFIVLREGRRSRAHRIIEQMSWEPAITADELAQQFRTAFVENGDKMQPVDRDLKRSLAHAQRSVDHFIYQYVGRSTLNFRDALLDYHRSNQLLFGNDPNDVPRSGGWKIPLPTSALDRE